MAESNNLDDMFSTLRNSEPYIADGGFTSGVIARLPEAQQLPAWLTNLILLGFTAVGSGLAAWQLPVMKLVNFTETSLLSLPVLGCAALATFLITYVVIWLAQSDAI